MKPSVLVIVLCYNGVDLTRACLASLRAVTYASLQVLVVDNASSDDTPAIVRREHPEAVVIETGANLGYAEGNNVGLRYAREHSYDYALLLNNDTEVAPDFVDRLVEAMQADPRIGVAGPKVYYFDRPAVLYSMGGQIDWSRGMSTMIGLDEADAGQFDGLTSVDFVSGCALAVRMQAVGQAGLIDPRFGMYFEETEWCVRIARAGWRIVCVPASVIWHKIDVGKQEQSRRIAYYMVRNRLLFLRLTRAPARAWLDAALLQDWRAWLSWGVRPKWKHRLAQRSAIPLGWRDFLRGRFGMADI